MKPILFNAEMVRAILEGRKTVTRRVIPGGIKVFQGETHQIKYTPHRPWRINGRTLKSRSYFTANSFADLEAPYWLGGILYVQETWQFIPCIDCGADQTGLCHGVPVTYEDKDSVGDGCFVYRADCLELDRICWRPSIHMPLEAARLFLRVTGVRVERLQEMVLADVLMEGIREADSYEGTWDRWHNTWNSTIKPADLPRYGWEANPWVFVVEFERISNDETMQ